MCPELSFHFQFFPFPVQLHAYSWLFYRMEKTVLNISKYFSEVFIINKFIFVYVCCTFCPVLCYLYEVFCIEQKIRHIECTWVLEVRSQTLLENWAWVSWIAALWPVKNISCWTVNYQIQTEITYHFKNLELCSFFQVASEILHSSGKLQSMLWKKGGEVSVSIHGKEFMRIVLELLLNHS